MASPINRRAFLQTSAISLGGIAAAGVAQADVVPGQDGFVYEVSKSKEDWLAQLGEYDFGILRMGGTELQKSSPLWNETRAGAYHCKGCDLHVYDGSWKVPQKKGWAFFRQSVPNSLLMNTDWPEGTGPGLDVEFLAAIEVHCRRCGSHTGHILLVDGEILHCINGASLTFEPTTA